MKLIMGLGNAGKEYTQTRHNLGMNIANTYAQAHRASFKKHSTKAEIASLTHDSQKLYIVRSTGFMNLSGEPLAEIVSYFNLKPQDIGIIYDDIDLPFGTIRVSVNESSGGHNGVKSIIQCLGSTDFVRIRLGIGPKSGDAADFVLARWTTQEHKALPEFTAEGIGAIETLLEQGLAATAALYN